MNENMPLDVSNDAICGNLWMDYVVKRFIVAGKSTADDENRKGGRSTLSEDKGNN